MAVTWQSWHDDLPSRAAGEGRPVLLVLVADWSAACGDPLERLLSQHEVATLIDEVSVPVRVDGHDDDENTALARRHGLGAWPTLALLDGEGAVLWSAVAPEADELAQALWNASRTLRGDGGAAAAHPERGDDAHDVDEAHEAHEAHEAAEPVHEPGALDESIPPAIARSLLSDFDSCHGGFGTGQKFPHPETLDYAILGLAEDRDPRLREIVEKTLSAMAGGDLRDSLSGAFFRCTAERDWRGPHTEIGLSTNAGLARNYLEAGQLLDRSDFLVIGEAALKMALAELFDEDVGLFAEALDADPGYYALGEAERRTRPGPGSRQRYVGSANARMVSALLKAGAVLGREDLSQRGADVAEQLLRRLWQPGKGMAHLVDDQGHRRVGRLADHAETARALLHVLQYRADRRFMEPLLDLVELIAAQHLLPTGELGDPGAQTTTVPSQEAILDGAVACEVLLRTALVMGRDDLHQLAVSALEVHADDFRRYGYAMAAYGRSVELVLHPPLHVVVVGADEDARSAELLDAASALYLPSRVVQSVDPTIDVEQLERLGLPPGEDPAVYIMTRRWAVGPLTTDQDLQDGLLKAKSLRQAR